MSNVLKIRNTCMTIYLNNYFNFDRGCSYLSKLLTLGCRLQRRFQHTNMTYESKVNFVLRLEFKPIFHFLMKEQNDCLRCVDDNEDFL